MTESGTHILSSQMRTVLEDAEYSTVPVELMAMSWIAFSPAAIWLLSTRCRESPGIVPSYVWPDDLVGKCNLSQFDAQGETNPV